MSQQTIIKNMTRGVYDIQQLRIQMGNRLVSNFKAKIGVEASKKEEESDEATKKILKMIKTSYDSITEGVSQVSKRTEFKYDGVISNYSELILVDLYITTIADEERHMRRLSTIVEEHPLWDAFFKDIRGVGGTMAGVILSEIDIEKAKYVSSIWKYAGLDVIDGEGRSRKKEHLEETEYVDKEGEVKTKKGITFNPFLKTKLVGVLGSSFLRSGGKYREVYDDYKNRIQNSEKHSDKSKGHIHNMAVRYMVKMFLKDLYPVWKEIEGLEAHPTYQEAKLDHKHKS